MSPQEVIEQLKALIKGFASKEKNISLQFFEDVKASILQIARYNPSIQDIDSVSLHNYYETAVKEHKSVYQIGIDPSSALTKKGFKTWLTDERKERIPKDYINRYLTYMRKEGRSEAIITELSRSSEDILSKLGDPQSSTAYYFKGLVVGSVQSGKTGNFNAVINRAVDSGYNLVIILSGIMEDLRSQTQLRLELDVIGEGVNIETEKWGIKGVGTVKTFGINVDSDILQVQSITSHKTDFKTSLLDAGFSLNNKNILVCKKNTSVLKNLLIWLSDYLKDNRDQHNIPLLIVDDEADNASLNNLGHKGREYASTINGHIRAILALFSRKTYLGYTATPFANVIQDRNEEAVGLWQISYKRNGELQTKSFNQVPNIFPDDFIELLEPPSNYVGAKQIFETTTNPDARKIPLVEPVNDCYESFPIKVIVEPGVTRPATQAEIDDDNINKRSPKKDDPFPAFLPASLKDAVECFLLGIAIRLKRRPAMAGSKLYNPHSTMLIHVSRFTDWQNRTRDLLQVEVNTIVEKIYTELPSSPKSVYAKLEKTWNKYYAAIIENIRTYLPSGYSDEFLEPVTFKEIKSLLPEAVKGLEVKAINSLTKDKLIYSTDASGNGKKYIAVGGNRLSRGFTLEGLTINYFIRDTSYADTLLQMGRWFGYRPGYIDCCKLFTTWDTIEKFDAVTRTIEELELEFKKMHRQGKTPDEFILRVRTHPDVLKITRPSILKNAEEVNWSYQDTLVQTTQFDMNPERIRKAWLQLKGLLLEYGAAIKPFRSNNFYLLETDILGLFKFLDNANAFHEYDRELNQIKAFIKLALEKGKLKRWRVAIKATGTGTEMKPEETGLLENIKLTKRSGPGKEGYYRKQLIEKGIFTSSGKSANLLSGGLDMSLWLNEDEIQRADNDFIAAKAKELRDYGMDTAKADAEANKKTKPENIYRERMSENNGLLVIYLMDLREVFMDDNLKALRDSKGIDETVPLIGYAIGFPKIDTQIGGVYVKGKYNINEDEPEADEFDEEILNMDVPL